MSVHNAFIDTRSAGKSNPNKSKLGISMNEHADQDLFESCLQNSLFEPHHEAFAE